MSMHSRMRTIGRYVVATAGLLARTRVCGNGEGLQA